MGSSIVAPLPFTPALLETRPEFKTNSVEDAAQEFEAMLIGLLLKSAREAGSVFTDEDKMTGGEGYLELAEQQLAKTLAHSGLLGFSRLLLQDLNQIEQPRNAPHPGLSSVKSGGEDNSTPKFESQVVISSR